MNYNTVYVGMDVHKESFSILTSLEMVVGSLHKNLAISLKEQEALRERSMYLRSSRERCFWLPGIYLLIEPPSTAVRRQI